MFFPNESMASKLLVEGQDNPAVDLPAIQAAVSNYDIVELKGTFDLGVSTIPGVASVVISKGTRILGKKDEYGDKPLIKGGYFAFMVLSAEDVVIENLHFYDSGGVGLYIGQVAKNARIEVKENEFTNSLFATFGDCTDPPPGELKLQRLRFNPDLQRWFHFSILVYPSGGNLQALKGAIFIEDNTINPEAEELPEAMSSTFYGAIGIHTIGTAAEGRLSVQGNTIRNCSWAGITIEDHLGFVQIEDNLVFMGPVGFYWKDTALYSGYGIGAIYAFFNLLGHPPVGGEVSIVDNTVVAASTDAIGIRANGLGILDGTPQTYGAVTIEGNKVEFNSDGYYGFYISNIKEAELVDNIVNGDAKYALMLGDDSEQMYTTGNIIRNLNLKHFFSLSGYDVALDKDTRDNVLEEISGHGDIIDLGEGNIIRR